MPFDPTTLACFPKEPGVYLMKNKEGKILYIGKATHLQNRLKQYFGPSKDSRGTIPYLMAQVETIETLLTLSEKDALLLEHSLIQKHQPKYNILLKDDKTFISILITAHKWPMIRLIRSKGSEKGLLFGPFPSAFAARQTVDLLLKIFPLRQCSDTELMQRQRPCLLYDIKRCIAPCVNNCTETEYQSHVEGAIRLLKGQNHELMKELKKKMEKESRLLEFEKAAETLRQIEQLKHVLSCQTIYVEGKTAIDILSLHRKGSDVLICSLLIREGKVSGSKHFSFSLIFSDDEEVFETFVLQHYAHLSQWPEEILISTPLPHAQQIEEILSSRAHHPIALVHPKKGKKKELLAMGEKNGEALFSQKQAEMGLIEKRLLDLQETLELERFPKRIECFDTSNLAGTDAVAALASFVDGKRAKGLTKLFKVKGSDDYTAMREVLFRYLKRAQEKKEFPDLLIVDGGKGHLHLAMEVLQELQITSIDLIALSKEEARHDKGLSQEKIYRPHLEEPLLIDPKSNLLFLLQQIRDEAHRLAISYHRKKRKGRLLSSKLDAIEGIGPVKKKRLLQAFHSVKRIEEASEEELLKVPGITLKDIQSIKKLL